MRNDLVRGDDRAEEGPTIEDSAAGIISNLQRVVEC